MCAGALFWSGICRVVYVLSETGLLSLSGDHPGNPTLDHPCRLVLAAGGRPIDVIGPLLEQAAAVPHTGFWGGAGGTRRVGAQSRLGEASPAGGPRGLPHPRAVAWALRAGADRACRPG